MSHPFAIPHDTTCGCAGRDGRPKRLYATKQEAEDCASYIFKTRDVRLRAYRCPWSSGWHLTSDVSSSGW